MPYNEKNGNLEFFLILTRKIMENEQNKYFDQHTVPTHCKNPG
jgi:hypothetical protein